VKGRKVYGDLVPFGKVWRTGANNATTIDFADDVTIGTSKVPAGKYGLLTIPDKDKWTIIISKQLDVTNPSAYKQEEDVARVEAKTMDMKDRMETFTMQFANINASNCELHIMWENTAVVVPISEDVETVVMKQIDNAMNKDNRPYFQAAMYYLNNNKDLNQALAWFDKAIEQQPDAFFIYHQKANTLAKLGRKEEAKAAAEKSIELAKAAKNDDYVRLNEKLIAQLK
jgi:tetratricopeptide (TPR) repeat protein